MLVIDLRHKYNNNFNSSTHNLGKSTHKTRFVS